MATDNTTNNIDPSLMGAYTSLFTGNNSFSYDTESFAKYSANGYTYPLDLFQAEPNPYGGNYVIFFINVAEDSTLLTGPNKEQTVNILNTDRLRAQINTVGAGMSTLAQAGTTIAAAVASNITKTIAKSSTLLGGLKNAINLKDISAAALGAGAVTAAAGGKMSRQQKRLQKVIALPIPLNLNVSYSTMWGETDTMQYQAMVNLSEGGMKMLSDSEKNKTKNNQMASNQEISTLASLATYAGLKTDSMGGALSAASGMAPNPKKEMLFQGVNFRSFQLDWQFAPKNYAELQAVYNIINTFKLHMHPEYKDAASFIYLYPSEFDIQYYHKKTENPYLHKHTSCILKDVRITYTPSGSFTTFSGDVSGKGAGAPTFINLSLSFVELAMLTKAEIQKGF